MSGTIKFEGGCPCRGCGRPLAFIRRPQTKKLSPVEPGWVEITPDPAGPLRAVRMDGTTFRGRRAPAGDPNSESALVLHFTTCPKANQFSRRKPRGERLDPPAL